ncbi:CHAP domain-containing protein [Actinosynnema sp. CA-248983]
MSRRVARSAVGLAAVGALLFGAAPALAQDEVVDPAEWRVRQDIVDFAFSQIGQREDGPNGYPLKYQAIDPAIRRPVEWCGIFVNWVWTKAGVEHKPSMAPAPGAPGVDQGHWATYWQKWGRQNGKWRPLSSGEAEMGDVIVYGDYPSMFAHVGVVVEVAYDRTGRHATHIRTVEGNVSDRVVYTKWRKISDLAGGAGLKVSGFVSPF